MNKPRSITTLVGALTASVLLSACQSTSTAPVITRADATYETTGLGKTKTDAQRDALAAAKKQCGTRNPVILKDTTKYNGIVDERTGRLIEQGAAVAGAVLGTGVPNLSRDDDYEYTISFRCEK